MGIPNRLRAALLLTLLLFAGSAGAGELSAIINGKSFHLDAAEHWNEDNRGIGVEYEFSSPSRWRTVVMANAFRDSTDAMSYMAGGGLHRNLFATDRLHGLYLNVGVNAFLMTRRDVNDNRPFPGVLPSMTVGNRYVGVNLAYLPRKAVEQIYNQHMQDDSMRGIVFLQLKVGVGALFGSD
ncbi:MAG: hypothetical protein R3288_06195 [Woeseiaceae bacterium]|nr:hypothetical protein [Woeseiaceae bacterium]